MTTLIASLMMGVAALTHTISTSVGNDVSYKRYAVEKGMVTYKVSGISSGTETIYWDQYGMREAKYTQTTSKMFGTASETNALMLLHGTTQYQIDLNTNSGTKTVNHVLKGMVEEDENVGEVGKRMLESMGGNKTGEVDFLNKPCEVWEVSSMAATLYVWNYISLRSESNLMGLTQIIEAVEIQVDIDIPEEKFAIPEGAKLQTIDLNQGN